MTIENKVKKCGNCFYWDKEHTSEICGRCLSFKKINGEMIFNNDNWKETTK